ncbi:MAG: hypothetical protein BWY76_01497 [bacterium ADurb.Bin429]|nr:MAG: hypothetical protein BWY76_01497 [bacterium ADurb.Bin429]
MRRLSAHVHPHPRVALVRADGDVVGGLQRDDLGGRAHDGVIERGLYAVHVQLFVTHQAEYQVPGGLCFAQGRECGRQRPFVVHRAAPPHRAVRNLAAVVARPPRQIARWHGIQVGVNEQRGTITGTLQQRVRNPRRGLEGPRHPKARRRQHFSTAGNRCPRRRGISGGNVNQRFTKLGNSQHALHIRPERGGSFMIRRRPLGYL